MSISEVKTPIIDIDLRTTNSLIAIWEANSIRIIPNTLGKFLTPSVVGMDENGPILASKAAEERLITHPFKTTFLFKRHMGFNKRVMLNDNSFRCEEFASFVLCALKANAQSVLEEPVTHASISVPAYFSDRPPARQAILRALYPERLINEPTTAVLAYRLHQKKAISPPLYLIWMAEHLMSHYLTFSTASRRFAPLPVTTLWVEKILFRPC